MRVFLSILFLMIAFQGLKAQVFTTQECDVPYSKDMRFDREAYELYKRNFFTQTSREVKRVPIAARIVRRSDGTGGLAPDQLAGIIDTLNVRFKGANLEFYACGDPEFVDVNVFYDFDRSIYADSLVTYNIPNVINIYFISKILNDDTFLCGYASFPWFDQEYVVVKNDCALNGSTLAHEIGHYLGLYHTHETFNGVELVDGSNCLFAGDEICDTPADPRLGTHNVNVGCDYTGSGRDANGKRYEPDPSNIMSYSRKACRDFFSPEQNARMNFYLERDRSHLECRLATDITVSHSTLGVQTFPNPVSGELTLKITSEKRGLLSLSLSDLQGREYQRLQTNIFEPHQNLSLQMGKLSSGVYVLRLNMHEENLYVKVIKN